jgi:ABC-type uncharacterized transport system substrate-binding protein
MRHALALLAAGMGIAVVAAGGCRKASAHPHVFIDARAEILFDAQGRMTHIRNVWEFDAAFSAFASQGLDVDGDGKLSEEELRPLAKVNVDSLKEYAYFTSLTVGGKQVALKFPDRYSLRLHGDRLVLSYQLPLSIPTRPGPSTTLEVYDPEYFVAFTFVKKNPVTLSHAPSACAAEYHAPRRLDASIMARLAAIPMEQHDLPPALRDAAVGLANTITVRCPQ